MNVDNRVSRDHALFIPFQPQLVSDRLPRQAWVGDEVNHGVARRDAERGRRVAAARRCCRLITMMILVAQLLSMRILTPAVGNWSTG